MGVDWAGLFTPSVPLLETLVRGSIVYFAVFLLLRFVLRREAGTLGIADLLVVVLIADAAQNAMAAEYRSITDGVLLVGTIVLCAYLMDWLAYRSPFFDRLVHAPPRPLVRRGRMLPRNMRQELITEEELRGYLRLHGIADIGEVEEARLESDGRISVVKRDSSVEDEGEPRRV
jgi:uncharacterized membrane protein YcaP (DUF421 family)